VSRNSQRWYRPLPGLVLFHASAGLIRTCRRLNEARGYRSRRFRTLLAVAELPKRSLETRLECGGLERERMSG
jgi:hypothetical protein